jgi:hypothetical protein
MRTLCADEVLGRIERADLERLMAILDDNARLVRESAGASVHTLRAWADAEDFEKAAFALGRLLTKQG